MSTDYCRSILRIAIAQCCQNLGWQSVQASALEILTDVLERYILQIGRSTHHYSEQFGRTDPVVDDVALAFQDMNISLSELSEYIKYVDPIACAVKVPDQFPKARENQLNIPEEQGLPVPKNREEHIPDYMPLMTTEWEEVDNSNKLNTSTASSVGQEIPTNVVDRSPLVDGPAIAKKSKLLPEEAKHSNYEMKSVKMSHSGFLSPIRQGKLPDARTPPPSTPANNITTTTPASSPTQTPQIKPKVLQMDSPKTKPVSPLSKPSAKAVTKQSKLVNKPSTKAVGKPAKLASKKTTVAGKGTTNDKPIKGKSLRKSEIIKKSPEASDKSAQINVASKLKNKAINKHNKSMIKKSPIKVKRSPTKVSLDDLPVTELVQAGTAPISPPTYKQPKSSPTKPLRSPSKSPTKSVGHLSQDNFSLSESDISVIDPLSVSQTQNSKAHHPRFADTSLVQPETPHLPKPKFSSTPQVITDLHPSHKRKKSDKRKSRKKLKRQERKSIRMKSELSPIKDESLETNTLSPSQSTISRQSRSPVKSFSRSPTKSMTISPVRSVSPTCSPFPSIETPIKSPVRSIRSMSRSPTRSRSWSPVKSPCKSPEIPIRSPAVSRSPSLIFSSASTLSPSKSPPKSFTHSPYRSRSTSPSTTLRSDSKTSLIAAYLSGKEPEDRKPIITFDDTDDESGKMDPIPITRVESWDTAASPKSNMFSDEDTDAVLQDIAKDINVKMEITSEEDGGFTSTSMLPASSVPPKKRLRKKEKTKSGKKGGKKAAKDSQDYKPEDSLSFMSFSKNFDFPDVSYPPDIKPSVTESTPLSSYSMGESSIGMVKPLKITFGGKDNSEPSISSLSIDDKDKEHRKKKKKNKDRDRRDHSKERKEKKSKHREKKDKRRDKSYDNTASVPKLTLKIGSSSSDVTVSHQKPNIPKLRIKHMDSMSSSHSTPLATPTLPKSGNSPRNSPLCSLSSSLASTSPASSPQQDPEKSPMSISMSGRTSSIYSDSHHTVSRETTPQRIDDTPAPTPPVTVTRGRGRPSLSSTSSTKPALPKRGPTRSSLAAEAKASSSKQVVPPSTIKITTPLEPMKILTETVGTIVDERGHVIWICPACKMPDDGTPMIGCDTCDDWYHWACVGIKVEPAADDSWFCTRCKAKKKPGRSRKKRR